jgi:hypothetical protein
MDNNLFSHFSTASLSTSKFLLHFHFKRTLIPHASLLTALLLDALTSQYPKLPFPASTPYSLGLAPRGPSLSARAPCVLENGPIVPLCHAVSGLRCG